MFYESVILFYLFGHWVQISVNWRSWLHIQNVYIHSYFTLIDFGALRKHIVTTNGDFVNLIPPWGQFLTNFGYFVTYLATGDKVRTIRDLGCKFKSFISIHTWQWWILGTLKKYILKNIDDFLILTPFNIKSPIMAVFTNSSQINLHIWYSRAGKWFIVRYKIVFHHLTVAASQ